MKIYILFILFLFCGCSTKEVLKVQDLNAMLEQITTQKQAYELSNDIFYFAKNLKQTYHLTDFSNLNNFLINLGINRSGLCWELAFEMLIYLKPKNYDIDYYIASANIGSYFHEHTVLVLTCKDCEFEKGVLIDVWRNGGEVYFQKVNQDEKYKWIQRGEKK